MSDDKAIRAAKLTLGALLDKRRAKEAKDRAGGQIAPSKYLPDVPRQAHASGGYVPAANLPVPRRLATAAPLQTGSAQPTALEALAGLAGAANKIGDTATGLFGKEEEKASAPAPQPAPSANHGGMSEAALAAWGRLTDAWGQPLTVNSAYRDPKRNEEVGGAKGSQHMHGNAYDIDASGLSYEDRLRLADAAWEAGFRGIGFYDNALHFDVADPRAWGPSYSRDSIPDWAQDWANQRYGYADGGEVTDLGAVRDQKQLHGFHKGLMSGIDSAVSDRMEAHQKALDAGHFDGVEMGDTFKGSVAPFKITGRFVRPWKPVMQKTFDRFGVQPSLVEHEGKQYVPMVRTLTGVKDSDDWQEGDAYVDLIRAAGYPKMGGLRAVKADGGAVAGGYTPQRTVKAYKLFRRKGDQLMPLFVHADKPVPMGQWLEAEEGPQGKTAGKVKSKLGDLAYRPGWHAGDLPIATHIGGKSSPDLKKPDYRPDDQVWAEIEMAADKDWQSVADSRGKGVKAHITDQVPLGGFYRYKTNPNMTGNWLIGGHMKVNRVLSDDEVKDINDQAGVADLPRIAKADGGSIADRSPMFEGMHEDLRDESGKPLDLWHGTPHQFDAFDNSKVGSERDMGFYGRGHYLTPDQGTAEEYAHGGEDDPENEGHIMGPLHAALKNPFIWDMSNENKAYSTKKALAEMGIHRDGKMDPWDNLRSHEIDTFMQHMQKRGHDGVIVKQPNWQDGEGANVTEIVVFNPNMIKHRDAEVGDPNDPRIMRADGGRIAASEWFTGSKIVHPDGRPKMVYHGTKRDFDAFGKKGVRSRFGPVQAALGHFLTDNPKLASAFATGKGGNVIPAYVSMRNPKVIPPDENGFSLTSRIEQDWTPEQAREFRRQAEADGHDGFIFQERSNLNAAGGHFDEIVAFHPHQIKSAFNPSPTDDPRIMRANGGKVDLYSKAARIIRGLKDQPMPVEDIIKYALGKGVKKAEIEHSDIPTGKARPSQVAEHIEFMQPQIGVERKGDLVNEFNRLMNGDMMSYTRDDFRRMDELDRMISEGGHLTQYPQYQLPGSKNYREHILTLENHPDDQTFMAKRHWGDLKNPLAHIRMSDRETPDGRKLLHIEEMQSDWNNAARNQGFRTGREKQDYDDFVADMRRQMIERVNARTGQDYYDPMTGEVSPTMSPMVAKAQIEKYQQMDPYMLALKLGVQERHSALARAANPNVMAPPKAPYINPKRDDWAELAMKHVLTEAAKGGYDGITFTPDAAQSQRWGGTNFEGIYDKKLPSLAHRLVQQHDPSVQPDQIGLPATTTPSALIPLTDTARDSIMKNGFSAFRRGGYVTHVRRGR